MGEKNPWVTRVAQAASTKVQSGPAERDGYVRNGWQWSLVAAVAANTILYVCQYTKISRYRCSASHFASEPSERFVV